MNEQVPSKKLISDERLRRLRADWAKADETGCYPGVIEVSDVLLVCDELIASRTAPEPPDDRPTDEALARFSTLLAREMPAGTVIGDPNWWARKLLNAAYVYLPSSSQPPSARPQFQRWGMASMAMTMQPSSRGAWYSAEEVDAFLERASQPPGALKPGLERAVEIIESIETPADQYEPYKTRLVDALCDAIYSASTKEVGHE